MSKTFQFVRERDKHGHTHHTDPLRLESKDGFSLYLHSDVSLVSVSKYLLNKYYRSFTFVRFTGYYPLVDLFNTTQVCNLMTNRCLYYFITVHVIIIYLDFRSPIHLSGLSSLTFDTKTNIL